ncbi:hypothetical protein J6590_010899 [Homalodisca vitripennis]|nr:hypothetical protein J6590_010899 [Homalodisca vitripennis]
MVSSEVQPLPKGSRCWSTGRDAEKHAATTGQTVPKNSEFVGYMGFSQQAAIGHSGPISILLVRTTTLPSHLSPTMSFGILNEAMSWVMADNDLAARIKFKDAGPWTLSRRDRAALAAISVFSCRAPRHSASPSPPIYVIRQQHEVLISPIINSWIPPLSD